MLRRASFASTKLQNVFPADATRQIYTQISASQPTSNDTNDTRDPHQLQGLRLIGDDGEDAKFNNRQKVDQNFTIALQTLTCMSTCISSCIVLKLACINTWLRVVKINEKSRLVLSSLKHTRNTSNFFSFHWKR